MPVNSDATTMKIKYNAPAVLALRRGDPSANPLHHYAWAHIRSFDDRREIVRRVPLQMEYDFVARSGRRSGSA
jgi:hypothetical protein